PEKKVAKNYRLSWGQSNGKRGKGMSMYVGKKTLTDEQHLAAAQPRHTVQFNAACRGSVRLSN
ncbi:unnamed protein product, partial [Ceratitis capitata]